MNRSELDPLLNEILAEVPATGFRQASLESALHAARQRRRRRLAARVGLVLVVAGALVWSVVPSHVPRFPNGGAPAVVSHAVAPATGNLPAASPHVQVISDDELFAMFPNRAVALVGKAGEQRLIFLDGGGQP